MRVRMEIRNMRHSTYLGLVSSFRDWNACCCVAQTAHGYLSTLRVGQTSFIACARSTRQMTKRIKPWYWGQPSLATQKVPIKLLVSACNPHTA